MRERLFDKIRKCALAYGIGIATAQEVDAFNILEATRLAARRALAQLDPRPAILVTDFLDFPDEPRPTLALVKGDAISVSVAAASILAKVTRDRLMEAYHAEFPYYGWNRNRGYPTQDHYDAIMEHGPSVLHRLTFSGVGFFNSELRRSRTFENMAAEVEALRDDEAGMEKRHELRARLDLCRAILPPPDAAELDELLR
jgi:ribonuclease HII